MAAFFFKAYYLVEYLVSVMMKFELRILLFVVGGLFPVSGLSQPQKIAGPLILKEGVADGYTLFAPLNTNSTYLIDNCGRLINKWRSNYPPGNTAYLMPNGNLVRTKRLTNPTIPGGGGGGGVELYDWNSNLLWSFEMNTNLLRLHHDIKFLPNGNILMIVWEVRTLEEALAAGRKPELIPANGIIWSERIIEVKPIPSSNYEIVWQWNLWDHLIQDFDDTKSGFGVVGEHPERVDVNYVTNVISDWIHANAIDYNAELDQIVLSSPFLNELWVIDHSTTTAQAATSSGGNSGKGGDLLYRWGNPQVYKQGADEDKRLFGQHDIHWIKEGIFKGKIMVFNNNKGSNFSSVDILSPPVNGQGQYSLTAGRFGPDQPVFSYTATPKENLFSNIMAGAEIQPNGNLLICSSRQGVFFEVTNQGDTVWYYKSPVTVNGIIGRDIIESDPNYNNDLNFRTIKYPLSYGAFVGRTIIPGEPIEGEPWACNVITSARESTEIEVYPNPVSDFVKVSIPHSETPVEVTMFNIQGTQLAKQRGTNEFVFDMSGLPPAVYILEVGTNKIKVLKGKN